MPTSNINELLSDVKLENFRDKDRIVRQLVMYMLARTRQIFIYNGLPETIPSRNLEQIIQINGNAFVTEVEGNLYAFSGGLGGPPNVYYDPTIYTVANPALNFSKNLKIDKDGILIRNDSYYIGLMPLFVRYASLQAENAISLRLADINTRAKFFISATDDRTKASADLFLERMMGGELGTILEQPLLEGLNINENSNQHSEITDLIEYEQYIKAAWYNEIGINANYNMKRESLNSSESQMNDDALLPLVDDMLFNRREGMKKINEMYGTEITVELNSVWKKEQMLQLITPPDINDETSEEPEEEEEEWLEEDQIQDPDDVEREEKEEIEEVKEMEEEEEEDEEVD